MNTHHIVARCDGGDDAPDNLVRLCQPCHLVVHADDFPRWGKMGGLIGGRTTLQKHGRGHFSKIGKEGARKGNSADNPNNKRDYAEMARKKAEIQRKKRLSWLF